MSLKVFRKNHPTGAEQAPTPLASENARQGKVAEAKLHAAFKELHKKYPMTWKKVTDTGVARNLVGSVESDYTLVISSQARGQPYSFKLEAKSSRVHESFSDSFKGLIRTSQLANMRLAERAGQIGVYVFFSVPTGIIEVWPATPVLAKYYERGATLGYPAYRITTKNLANFALTVAKNPAEFLGALMRAS